MPAVHPPVKVLITGVTGYIGAWITRTFLERCYDVLGTVRSSSKGKWLADQDWVKGGPGKFEYLVVEDIEAAGAFDEAVKDVAAVVHTASPVTLVRSRSPFDVINPAVNGTLGLLNSVLKNGNAVKRVVITSSVGAILEPTNERRTFTEKDWNSVSERELELKGLSVEPLHTYRVSKTRSEKAVWSFVEQHKDNLSFEVTTILPGFVYGPIIHDVPSIDKLNASMQTFRSCVHTEVPLSCVVGNGNYVDVRDVAAMHVAAIEIDEAAGQRIIANAGQHTWQNVYDALNRHANPIPGIPVGTPGATAIRPICFSNEKAKDLLGMEFRSLDETCYDSVVSLKERGLW